MDTNKEFHLKTKVQQNQEIFKKLNEQKSNTDQLGFLINEIKDISLVQQLKSRQKQLQMNAQTNKNSPYILQKQITGEIYLRLVVFIQMNINIFIGDNTYIKKRFYQPLADYICSGDISLIQKIFDKVQWKKKKILPYLKKLKKNNNLTNQMIEKQKQRYLQFLQWKNGRKEIQLYQKELKLWNIMQKMKQQYIGQISPHIYSELTINDKNITNRQFKTLINLKQIFQKVVVLKSKVTKKHNYQEFIFKNSLIKNIQLHRIIKRNDFCQQNYKQQTNHFNRVRNYGFMNTKSQFFQLYQKLKFPDQNNQMEYAQQINKICSNENKNVTERKLQNWSYIEELIYIILLKKNEIMIQDKDLNRKKGIFNEFSKYLPQKNIQSIIKHYFNLAKKFNKTNIKQIIKKQIQINKFTQEQLQDMRNKIFQDSARNRIIKFAYPNNDQQDSQIICCQFQQNLQLILDHTHSINQNIYQTKNINKYLCI